jgi:hypothetical protein
MSKKATRRAARQAFPKAKTPTPTKGVYGTRSRPPAKSRSRVATRQTVKPPSFKRAALSGAIMALLYFVLIQWAWKSGATVAANLLIALAAFILFAGVVYGVDRFKYQRFLRKQKQSTK